MAIRHGLAGQYAKNESKKITFRVAMAMVAALLVGVAIISFLWGYFFSIRSLWLGLVVVMLIGLPMLWLWRWLDSERDKLTAIPA